VGGSAAGTARAFAAAGGQATFIGAVGDDALGRRLIAALRADGVTMRVVRTAHATARLVALLSADGERTFVTERGSADLLAPDDLRPAWFGGLAGLHLPAYSLLSQPLADASLRAIALARARGATVSVDLASRVPLLARGRADALARVRAVAPDILFANASEAAALASRTDASDLLDLSPVLVIKEGARGSRIVRVKGTGSAARHGADAVTESRVATAPLHVVDSTGAGDAYDAGFLHAILGERDPRRALARASSLSRAARAGHRAAARLLSEPRAELEL
jgi:ribokinase